MSNQWLMVPFILAVAWMVWQGVKAMREYERRKGASDGKKGKA